MGLFDMVLIKDNHISAAGGISNAIKSVDLYLQQRELKMNVEVLSQILTFLFVYIVVYFVHDILIAKLSPDCLEFLLTS